MTEPTLYGQVTGVGELLMTVRVMKRPVDRCFGVAMVKEYNTLDVTDVLVSVSVTDDNDETPSISFGVAAYRVYGGTLQTRIGERVL